MIYVKKFLIYILFLKLLVSCEKVTIKSVDLPKPQQNTVSGENMTKKTIKILALGDSYTIGQGVADSLRFPNQVAKKLLKSNIMTEKVKIIARTGWRTDNLIDAIKLSADTFKYDFVFLLIGVNNQYQNRNINVYKSEFKKLIQTAISYANNSNKNVITVSIPDYGFTPFGASDKANISTEIDAYNTINFEISSSLGVNYVTITDISRSNVSNLVASDDLHPSGIQYGLWADRIYDKILKILQ